jgi:diaminohydroxyphosphoribosylaminopyrimidine deaminase/5-amino-6-(5-phosphoribosylamino)uracil reductase
MERALALARRGWGRVAPNPLVGAVLLRDGEVIGEGYHAEYGESHAEVAALGDCPDPAGATMVVSLEPCNHAGKTPPCTNAIVEAGVSRVVLPLRDPTPEAGGGANELREAGVEVDEGLMSEEAAALNAPFLWAQERPDRPFIALKVASSLDGLLADESGRSKWISGAEAREYARVGRAPGASRQGVADEERHGAAGLPGGAHGAGGTHGRHDRLAHVRANRERPRRDRCDGTGGRRGGTGCE